MAKTLDQKDLNFLNSASLMKQITTPPFDKPMENALSLAITYQQNRYMISTIVAEKLGYSSLSEQLQEQEAITKIQATWEAREPKTVDIELANRLDILAMHITQKPIEADTPLSALMVEINMFETYNASNIYGSMSLISAIYNQHNAFANMLIEAGADINIRTPNQISPLMIAALGGSPKDHDWVTLLIKQGASVDAIDDHQTTTLMYAARGGNPDILQQIMCALPPEHKKIDEKNTQGDTALHCAAQQSKNVSSQAATILIEAGADINATNQAGHTPLKIAYQKGNKQNILNILKHGQSLHFNGSPLVYWHIIAWKKLAHALFSQPQAQIPVERSNHTPAVELTQDPLSNATHDLASDANLENGPSTPQEDTHSAGETPSTNANKNK
jgi:ankyrin repeat protein